MMINSSMLAKLRPTQLLGTDIAIRTEVSQAFGGNYLPWTVRKWVESILHELLVLFEPSFRSEGLDVVAPHVFVSVDRVRRDAENGALGEELPADRQTALRDETRKTHTRRGVDAQRLVNNRLEVCQLLDFLERRHRIVVVAQGLIKLLLEFALHLGVVREVVRNGTG